MNAEADLINIRHQLHKNPELSGKEFRTAKLIKSFILPYQPTTVVEQVGGTGLLVIFDSGFVGKTVLFRSELDALPIDEINDFEYRSNVKNVSHKCGHDGHSTILIGLAKQLYEHPIKKGKVILLFQPAEETGEGACAVLKDKIFESHDLDYVFALHNLPGYPLHKILVKNDFFTAAVKSVEIKLIGKTAHAAEPEHGTNPAMAIARILQRADVLSNNNPSQDDFAVVTPVHVNLGSIDYGISAGYGELRLTLRSWSTHHLQLLTDQLTQIIEQSAHEYKLEFKIKWLHYFAPVQNDAKMVEFVSQAAMENDLQVEHARFAFKWGEDFGLFTQKYSGVLFGLGAGENSPALHNPDYDFPDELIPTGVKLFYRIASKILG